MTKKYILGIDISWCQGANVDMQSVKDANIKFVICKATHGATPTAIDPTFSTNWKRCSAVGLARGSYMWWVPSDDPVKQADHYCTVLKANGYNSGDLPPCIDFEQQTTILGQPLIDRLLITVKRIRELTGRKPLLYTGKWYYAGFCKDIDNPELVSLVDLFHAEYPSNFRSGTDYVNAIATLPAPHLAFPWASRGIAQIFHQFDGDHGLLLPQGTDSDFDVFWGDEADFVAWMATTFITATPAPEPAPEPVPVAPAPPAQPTEPVQPVAEPSVQPEAPVVPEDQQSGMSIAGDNNNILAIILNLIKMILTWIAGGKK